AVRRGQDDRLAGCAAPVADREPARTAVRYPEQPLQGRAGNSAGEAGAVPCRAVRRRPDRGVAAAAADRDRPGALGGDRGDGLVAAERARNLDRVDGDLGAVGPPDRQERVTVAIARVVTDQYDVRSGGCRT